MEIFMLVLMYYLSQNPHFAESVKPLMSQLKNSEQMLRFLNDLSNFTQTFSTFQSMAKEPCAEQKSDKTTEKPQDKQEKPQEKNPQSATAGIADDFIEKILQGYLQKNEPIKR